MKFGTNMRRVCQLLAAACASAAGAGAASAAITIATVPVGNVGNAADTTGYGSVGYSYNIGEYDVTATQYTAFLNAVAGTDTYGLYNSGMATASFASCGISQSGGPGSYSYATTKNGDFPMNYVSWGDAARFCNWLTNNQPTGAEGIGTTETGSYTLNGVTSPAALSAITRNAGADYVIPTENEWYKAAYYNPSSSGYYRFPTRSNTPPSNVLSATGTSNANYNNNAQYTDPINYLTPVGAFAASPSSYGTFDQGGDVFQWNETCPPQSSRQSDWRRAERGVLQLFRRSATWRPTPASPTVPSSGRHLRTPMSGFVSPRFLSQHRWGFWVWE